MLDPWKDRLAIPIGSSRLLEKRTTCFIKYCREKLDFGSIIKPTDVVKVDDTILQVVYFLPVMIY